MPTLTSEDGTPNGGNTFIDVAFLDAYLSDRDYSISENKESWLIKAYDFMSTLNWKTSHYVEFEVTDSMKKAQAEIAYRMSQGVDVFTADNAIVKKEKVDVLETEYFESNSLSPVENFPQALAYISNLIGGTSSEVGTVPLIR